MDSRTVYFKNPGRENTSEVFSLAKRRASELGIKTIVVASTTGWTAIRAAEELKGFRTVVVTHSDGLKGPNTQEFLEENRRQLEGKGLTILTATHAFGGLNRAMQQSTIATAPHTYVTGDVVANTLRIFGQGMKVACEITAMAADAGLIRTDEDVVSIAGTGALDRGADVAIVIRPSYTHTFFETRVREILCKPHF
jgi:uncharacterized protein